MRKLLIIPLLFLSACIIPLDSIKVAKTTPIINTDPVIKIPLANSEKIKLFSWKNLNWKKPSLEIIGTAFSQGKYSILFFSKSNCKECQMMLNESWSDPLFQSSFESITLMLGDVENPEDANIYGKIIAKLNLEMEDPIVPALVLFIPNGFMAFKSGYMSKDDFADMMRFINEDDQAKSKGQRAILFARLARDIRYN